MVTLVCIRQPSPGLTLQTLVVHPGLLADSATNPVPNKQRPGKLGQPLTLSWIASVVSQSIPEWVGGLCQVSRGVSWWYLLAIPDPGLGWRTLIVESQTEPVQIPGNHGLSKICYTYSGKGKVLQSSNFRIQGGERRKKMLILYSP